MKDKTKFNAQEYWETRLHKKLSLGSVGYIGLGDSFNYWAYNVRKSIFRTIATDLLGEFTTKRVLDIGCGSGFYVERWKEQGVTDLTGIDITQVAVDRLKQNYPEYSFFQADIGSDIATISQHQFDVISAFDIFFHITDDENFKKAIQNVYSLLKPNSYLIFSDFFVNSTIKVAEHVVFRSLDSIEATLRNNGLEIIKRRPMLFFMNEPLDSTSRFIKLFWRIISHVVSKSERVGFLTGALLFPLEILFTRFAKESPTTEILICKKP